ncbi:MAG: ubiquinol-cytochrome c reductase iron-sulfur subunit [Thermoleophilaceae bacterium]
MRRIVRLIVGAGALTGLALGRGKPKRIVPPGEPDPRAELSVIVLLLLATLASAAFVWIYADDGLRNHTQWEGLTLGLALAFISAALIVVAKRLIVTEYNEEDYPEPETPQEQLAVAQIVRESGSRFTRKRLLRAVAGMAGGTLGLAFLAPAASLGPALDSHRLLETPWRRGKRLVREDNVPVKAADIEPETFYTAFAEGASHDLIGAPLIVVRLDPADLRLPRSRRGWAPQGIVAYSKICTHAGCAIALYRKPTFPPVQARPAFVCPCHYSTFDPASGGTVLFGPAGRELPQLPLMIDGDGNLRAAGNFSGPPGPSWWGVRMWRARFNPK